MEYDWTPMMVIFSNVIFIQFGDPTCETSSNKIAQIASSKARPILYALSNPI